MLVINKNKICCYLINVFFCLVFFRNIFPSGVFEILIVVNLVIMILLSKAITKKQVNIFIMFSIFLSIVISQVFTTGNLDYLVTHIFYLFQGIMIFILIVYFLDFLDFKYVVSRLIFWAVLASVISVILFVIFINTGNFSEAVYSRTGFPRLSGFQANPNYLSLTLCFIPILLLIYKGKYVGLKVVVVLLAIILTGSRGGILAAFTPVLIYFLIKNIRYSLYVLLAIIVIFFIINSINLDNIYGLSRFQSSDGDYSSGRFTHWLRAWELFSNNIMYGVGNNSFILYELENGRPIQVHNNYLRILSEFGVVGFLTWFILLFYLIKESPSRINSLLIISPMLIFGLVNDPYIAKEFWLCLALCYKSE